MKKFSLLIVAMILMAGIFTGCGEDKNDKTADKENTEVTVLAAASLTDALDEIIAEYNKECDDKITTSYAGSGDLVQQIEGGAPCDLFISASKKNMDQLEEKDLIDKNSRKDLLGNSLTLVASKEKAKDVTMDALTTDKVEKIAIGEPETVPAGNYATQVFDSMKITKKIDDKIVKAKDVKAVLNYVETGDADCGFVYKTDALLLKSGKEVETIDSKHHDPIVYPSAIMKDAPQSEAAKKFYEFLETDYAKKVFKNYGFTVK